MEEGDSTGCGVGGSSQEDAQGGLTRRRGSPGEPQRCEGEGSSSTLTTLRILQPLSLVGLNHIII